MKKAITILAVLIVLVGAVFAAETHTIKMKADVTAVVPVFGLKYNTSVSNTTTGPDGNGQYTNNYLASGTYNERYGTVQTAVETGLKLDQGGDVKFWAVLLNPAKETKNSSLTFSDGRFTVTENGVANTTVYIDPTITTPDEDYNNDVAGFSVADGADDDQVYVSFDGKQVVNNAGATGLNLASANYHYSAHPNVDMPADGDFYYADVILTVTTRN